MTSAQHIIQRIETLAKVTDVPGNVTRTFASPAMRRANELVGSWMQAAGMQTRVDAMGNLIGHYAGVAPDAKTLLLGSHLDTVRNAGKYDGPLGVILAIACVDYFYQRKLRLPFAIEVIGFSDEEGVRFQTAYLGSKALAGGFNPKELQCKDADGITLAEAIQPYGGNLAAIKSAKLNPRTLLGYVEAHIEQGPVLEQQKLAVGTVSAIAGQTRARIRFIGRAGHAGTTPMDLRRDALCAAAEFILAVESLAQKTSGAVATVGEISPRSPASNVIPGEVDLTLDVRHEKDAVRQSMHTGITRFAREIARRRRLKFDYRVVHETAAVKCSPELSELLGKSVQRRQKMRLTLPSGAGHDAAMMARICPVAMLFIRCKGGVSHHPDESVKTGDVQIALDVMVDFLQALAEKAGAAGQSIRQTGRQSVKT